MKKIKMYRYINNGSMKAWNTIIFVKIFLLYLVTQALYTLTPVLVRPNAPVWQKKNSCKVKVCSKMFAIILVPKTQFQHWQLDTPFVAKASKVSYKSLHVLSVAWIWQGLGLHGQGPLTNEELLHALLCIVLISVILSDARPVILSDGRPFLLSDGRPRLLSDGRPLLLSDGRPLLLSEGRLVLLSDSELVQLCFQVQQAFVLPLLCKDRLFCPLFGGPHDTAGCSSLLLRQKTFYMYTASNLPSKVVNTQQLRILWLVPLLMLHTVLWIRIRSRIRIRNFLPDPDPESDPE